MQGQRVAELAPQAADQAATSHQAKVITKGEGRARSAQVLSSQLVSVIFHTLAQCQDATTFSWAQLISDMLTQFSLAPPYTLNSCAACVC